MTETPTELETLSLELLEIESVIGEERAIADHCEAWARERGVYGIVRAGDNLAIQPCAFENGRRRVLLLGHLDTVPRSRGDDNTPRLEGDRIHGLGASDMKCADAILLRLCERAVRQRPRHDLAIVLYAREEGPFSESGMPEILSAAPGCFSQIDLAIAMEPTDNRFELGCLGTMHARVRFAGKRAHSARPWQGHNAIHRAAPLLGALAVLEPRDCEYHGLVFREVCSATMIEYEGARNVVPGACTVNLNFRFAPDRSIDEASQWVHDFVHDAVGADAFADHVEIEIVDACPAGRVCGDNETYLELRGLLPNAEVVAKQAWTDVGRLSQYGLDAINFGPGHTAQAHQIGEFASRRLLEESERVLVRWLWGEGDEG
ncbi:MAG: succinyl-diaminopimelate desuccinylase [Planctomycetes bacterium]|nr:succinyl-diaminopimelate desuccinylase [Planctomycetota bacterium]